MVEALLLGLALTLAQGEAPSAEAVDVAPEPEVTQPPEDGPSNVVSLFEYQFASPSRADVGGGPTKVSVETNAPAPTSGSFPVRVFLDNTQGPAQVVQLRLGAVVGGRQHSVERAVELRAGERLTALLPAFSEMRYGTLTARGPGITEGGSASVFFQATYPPQRVVLTLTTPEQFRSYLGRAPRYSDANVLVQAIPPGEAPTELASYLGFDLVVVPSAATFDDLDPAARSALEQYVASGGHLLVGGPLRGTAMFPLLPDARGPELDRPYGFGRLMVTRGAPADGEAVFRPGLGPNPLGPRGSSGRRAGPEGELLLPQASAPLGRFLLIIALFTLAIGPGSVWISRRRSPTALLVSIPTTAALTCVLIVGYSLVADGFTVHAASHGYTLLDAKSHRAITQGLTAYYANLAPAKAAFSSSTMLVAPWVMDSERPLADLSWGSGLTLGSDFVPSRTYREWGFVSVEPTRARLLLREKEGAWVVQNALGLAVDRVLVDVDGALFGAGPVAEGGEATLSPVPGSDLQRPVTPAVDARFSPGVVRQVKGPLRSGEFLARATGQGFVPTGGIEHEASPGVHWIRGEVER